MRHRHPRAGRGLALWLGALGLCFAPALVRAQGLDSIDPAGDNTRAAPTGVPGVHDSGALPDASAQGDQEKKDKDTKEPPPTLPGSHAEPIPSAPADKTVADLNPNAALFDAINRGDTVAARDALSRGADPGALNVLGLTPIDLAIDLGRNDISFLLLSVRGSNTVAAAPVGSASHPRVADARHAAAISTKARHAPVTVHAAAPAPTASASATGFLGFGGGS